jgi:hypothetical protein
VKRDPSDNTKSVACTPPVIKLYLSAPIGNNLDITASAFSKPWTYLPTIIVEILSIHVMCGLGGDPVEIETEREERHRGNAE